MSSAPAPAAPVYPVALKLDGRRCLVVGGGEVAVRKVEGLVASGAVLTVVAPEVDERIAATPGVTVVRRRYRSGDLAGHHLAIAATNDPEVNAAVYADGERRGVWVNSADDPDHCTFILPAVARSGDVTVAVSTAGASPALAQFLRDRCASELDGADGLAEVLAEARRRVRASGRSTEGLPWRQLVEGLARDRHVADPRLPARQVDAWLDEQGVRR